MVLICDIDVNKIKNSGLYDNVDTSSLKDMDWYLNMAERCIGKFAGSFARRMLNDEDAISFVANHMMMGSCRFSEGYGCLLTTYLTRCAIWSISKWRVQSAQAAQRSSNGDSREPDSLHYDNEMGDDALYAKLADPKALEPYEILSKQDKGEIDFKTMLSKRVITERECEVLTIHYGEDVIASEIARRLDVSRERVRQLIEKGISRIKEYVIENAIEV